MGYFKRPIRRGEARKAKRALHGADCKVDPSEWSEFESWKRPPRASYLRFVVQTGKRSFTGLFRAAELLDEDESLPDSVREEIQVAFQWFDRNVRAPRRLTPAAVCWFRSESADAIAKLRVLIEAYRMSGRQVLMQATPNPGKLVYQDEHQVAAIPLGHRASISAI